MAPSGYPTLEDMEDFVESNQVVLQGSTKRSPKFVTTTGDSGATSVPWESRLPLDIYQLIMDFASSHRDLYTMRSCSLTCRAWLPHSRAHLFGYLSLNGEDAFHRYVAFTKEYPNIPYFVHTLLIHARVITPETSWRWPSLLPILLARNLTSLRELDIRLPLVSQHPSFYMTLSQFKALTLLSVSGPIHATVYDFILMVVAFPCLKSLRANLDGLTWPSHNPKVVVPSNRRYAERPRLESLELRALTEYLDKIISWILMTPSKITLRYIWVELFDERSISLISPLLRASGDQLSRVDLDYYGEASPTVLESIDLSANSHLKQLSLPRTSISHLPTICVVLSRIRSPVLQEVFIKLSTDDSATTTGWSTLDDVLSRPQFSSLERIHVQLSDRRMVSLPARIESNGQAESMIPKLKSKGILSVVNNPAPLECMIKW